MTNHHSNGEFGLHEFGQPGAAENVLAGRAGGKVVRVKLTKPLVHVHFVQAICPKPLYWKPLASVQAGPNPSPSFDPRA
eukprot:3342521-Pyramimonas_sp.AAC.2